MRDHEPEIEMHVRKESSMEILPPREVRTEHWTAKVEQYELPNYRDVPPDAFKAHGKTWSQDPAGRPWFDRDGAAEKIDDLVSRGLIPTAPIARAVIRPIPNGLIPGRAPLPPGSTPRADSLLWPALAREAKTPRIRAPRTDESPDKSPILDRPLAPLTTHRSIRTLPPSEKGRLKFLCLGLAPTPYFLILKYLFFVLPYDRRGLQRLLRYA